MYDFMFYSGIAAWVVFWTIGIFFASDWVVGHMIDSVRFKIFVVRYIKANLKQSLGN